jgi:hypothetical protein
VRARGDSSSLVLERTGVCVGSVDLLVSVDMLCKFAQVQMAILTVGDLVASLFEKSTKSKSLY